MHLQRKVYETRAQKVGDFAIGVGLMIGINAVIGVLLVLLTGGMGAFSSPPGTNAPCTFPACATPSHRAVFTAPLTITVPPCSA